MLHPDGPAPRFGSCYFLLYPEVSRRSTFTYLDSHQNPTEKGTYEAFEMILAALLKEAYVREFAVGEPNLTPPQLVERMRRLGEPIPNPAMKKPSRNLNHYIEAQVHGDISQGGRGSARGGPLLSGNAHRKRAGKNQSKVFDRSLLASGFSAGSK